MKEESANWKTLADELELLNLCLLQEVRRRARGSGASQLDQFHGLVLSEHEVLAVLASAMQDVAGDDDGDEDLNRRYVQLEEQIVSRHREAAGTPLMQLVGLFRLSRREQQCLLLCLAPEIDANYAKVFAFLQDDVTQKQPSIDLALKLFSRKVQARVADRAIFAPTAPLIRNRLLQFIEAPDGGGAFLQRRLKLDERIAAFLLDTPLCDGALSEWVEFAPPGHQPSRSPLGNALRERTLALVEKCFAAGTAAIRPVIHLHGRPGVGKRSIAEALSQRMKWPLLRADARRLSGTATERAEAWWRLGREALLLPAVLLIEHFDELQQDSRSSELSALLDAVSEYAPLTLLAGTQAWKSQKPGQYFLSLECAEPDATARRDLWEEHLRGISHRLSADDLIELAGKFSLTDGQIREALQSACDWSFWSEQSVRPLSAQPVTLAALQQACRRVATPNLGGLARKIKPHYTWDDIVLPDPQLAQLHELMLHVKRAPVVLETWGFADKLPYGRGVTALFNGSSGTGKTMAASILGGELELDLYKIDLSCVVSKYIGETEKNLNQIFAEAQSSNALLFFDEADALFGKRSEVKDAHDRYANIETAYLLQRIEDYSGVVILATNMKQNMDEAFVRRMRFIIHFPFPSEIEREGIWEKAFPARAPLSAAVDFRWLARKLKITGGHIKNISLRAAFLASARQTAIDMDCLVEASRRELGKTGKIIALGDYGARENPEEVFAATGAT